MNMMNELRTPPHDDELERMFIGCTILDNSLLETYQEYEPSVFYRESHRLVWSAILEIYRRDEPVESLGLVDMLDARGHLDAVGGPNGVSKLTSDVVSVAYASFYAMKVLRFAKARERIAECYAEIDALHDKSLDWRAYCDKAQSSAAKLGSSTQQRGILTMPKAIKEGFASLEKAYNEKTVDGVSGLDTGLLDVNAHTSGLHPGELVILAARPAMGKTALALQIAMNLALHPSESRRAPVAVFSLEMSTAKLAQRMMSMHGRVDASRMRSGRMTEDDWDRIVKHAGKLSEAEIYIDDTAGIGLFDMKAKIRQLALEKGIKLVVIDYLQLVRTPHLSSRTNREQQIAEVSRELKAIAKDFGVCVLALAQLNRGVESRADKRPMNSDLRESGQIEQDADVITFLYRDEVYNDASEHKGVAELIFGKHRNGDIGTVRLKWQKAVTRFDNLAQHDTGMPDA